MEKDPGNGAVLYCGCHISTRGLFGSKQLFVPFDLIFLDIYSKEIVREAEKSNLVEVEIPLSLQLQGEKVGSSVVLPPGSNFSNFLNVAYEQC